ncbi:hypothetical protein SCHPADRAFT_538803 [Schizopora paradoxa]|uniref:Uncharacterized protein n=1 Tax=Schizopora paradoxa TaxID=27342 RepID=A0A0H2RKQ7_9AGAM|nr:hypothetical protein SCHPADRAFT_538803 [Schizopora paradoxa]
MSRPPYRVRTRSDFLLPTAGGNPDYGAVSQSHPPGRRGGLRQPRPAPLISSFIDEAVSAVSSSSTNSIPPHLIEYRNEFREHLECLFDYLSLHTKSREAAEKTVRSLVQQLHAKLAGYLVVEEEEGVRRYRLKHQQQPDTYQSYPIVKLSLLELFQTETDCIYDARLMIFFEDPTLTREAYLCISLRNPTNATVGGLNVTSLGDFWDPGIARQQQRNQQRCLLQ